MMGRNKIEACSSSYCRKAASAPTGDARPKAVRLGAGLNAKLPPACSKWMTAIHIPPKKLCFGEMEALSLPKLCVLGKGYFNIETRSVISPYPCASLQSGRQSRYC